MVRKTLRSIRHLKNFFPSFFHSKIDNFFLAEEEEKEKRLDSIRGSMKEIVIFIEYSKKKRNFSLFKSNDLVVQQMIFVFSSSETKKKIDHSGWQSMMMMMGLVGDDYVGTFNTLPPPPLVEKKEKPSSHTLIYMISH